VIETVVHLNIRDVGVSTAAQRSSLPILHGTVCALCLSSILHMLSTTVLWDSLPLTTPSQSRVQGCTGPVLKFTWDDVLCEHKPFAAVAECNMMSCHRGQAIEPEL